jgi:hypothetical protein
MCVELGYDVFETDDGLQLQKEDEKSPYENDIEAAIACLNDAWYGDVRYRNMIAAVLTQDSKYLEG